MFDPARARWAESELCPEVEEVASGSFRDREPPVIAGAGYAARSLEAALWAFDRAETFADAVLRAVNLGDDADTTGAICGQIAGAYYGAKAFPRDWLEALAAREMIEEFTDKLLQARIK